MKKLKSQKGLSIYLVILILSVILTISFGLSIILITQTKITREIKKSIVALYAADSGIEHTLYNIYILGTDPPTTSSSIFLGKRWSYAVKISSSTVNISPTDTFTLYQIKSLGAFDGIQRAIESSYY